MLTEGENTEQYPKGRGQFGRHRRRQEDDFKNNL
jgi:hypothetical protein